MAAKVFTRRREEMPVLVEREFGLGDVVARLRVAEERLGPRADPFHRPSGELGGEQHQRRLVENRRLHAEAAADVAGDDADLAFGHLEHLRKLGAVGCGALHRRIDRVAAIGGVVDRRRRRAAPSSPR